MLLHTLYCSILTHLQICLIPEQLLYDWTNNNWPMMEGSVPRNTYARWDFDNFDEQGLQPLVDELASNKIKVADVDGTNKATRVSGELTKRATLSLSDGQSVLLLVTSQGALYQVRINNRTVGIRETESVSKFATELAVHIKRNRPAHEKKMAALAEKALKPETSSKKRAASKATQLKEWQATLESAKQNLAKAEASLAEQASEVQTLRDELADLDSAVDDANARNTDLERQISELERGDNE